MAISAVGIVFSSLNNNTLSRLTSDRTVAAIPFACRYRLIDFCLSNLVNANIFNIHIVANYNYRSLLEHIGSGKDWDLARRSGGINMIAPFQTAIGGGGKMFSTHMEALKNMREYIDEFKEEYVVLMDSDYVLNVDISDVILAHEKTGAAVTFVTRSIAPDYNSKSVRMMLSAENGIVSDIAMNSSYNEKNPELSLNIFVMKTVYLRKIIEEAEAYSIDSLTKMLLAYYKRDKYMIYRYTGYVASVSSFLDYYNRSIELATDSVARESLFGRKNAPIFTRVHNSAPTLHKTSARVENSMIADECVIEGVVINSVIFRGVTVEEGAVVKNSVLFHGTKVGKGAELNCIVTDKDVVITDNVKLSGNDNMPFYVQKNRRV